MTKFNLKIIDNPYKKPHFITRKTYHSDLQHSMNTQRQEEELPL